MVQNEIHTKFAMMNTGDGNESKYGGNEGS